MEDKNINKHDTERSLTLEEKNALLREARAAQKNARIEERAKRLAEELSQSRPEPEVSPASSETAAPIGDGSAEITQEPTQDEQTEVKKSKKRSKKQDHKPRVIFSLAALTLSLISLVMITVILLSTADGLTPKKSDKDVIFVNVSDGTNSGGDSQKGEDVAGYANMLENAMKSVVIVVAKDAKGLESTGTGIILSENGYILTNFHVVSGATEIQIKLKGASLYTKASLVGYKLHDDIAVLKVELTDLPAATFGKSASCRVGDRVFAIGCPQGADYAWSVTQGIISAPMRDLKIYDADTDTVQKKMRVIQTDTPVNPGNSGGPLIDSSGHVLGIITLKLSDTSGMGFALPIDLVLTMVEGIIENGSGNNVQSTIASGRPLLGITAVAVESGTYYADAGDRLEIVSADVAAKYPDATFYCEIDGILVRETNNGSDASKKLMAGDTITHVNKIQVLSVADVAAIINDLYGGDTIEITFVRGGKTMVTNIQLSEAEIQ